MASPSPQPRPRGRSRRRLVLATVVVGFLVLIGRGLGLAGNESEPSNAPPQSVVSPSTANAASVPRRANDAPPVVGSAAPGPMPQSPTGTGAGADAGVGSGHGVEPDANGTPQPVVPVPAGPLGETGTAATASPEATVGEVGARHALDADRFASLLSVLGEQTTLGDLAAAVATLAHLRSGPLDGAQRTALLAPAQALEDALTKRCTQVVQQIGTGHVLTARALAQALSNDGRSLPATWFQAAWAAAGRPAVPAVAATPASTAKAGTLPLPKALPRGRAVRVAFGAHAGDGTIADSRAEVATVRLAKDSGFVFPTVPVASLEPIDPTADEAVEMAFAALQHDDPLLARLWQWVAVARQPAGTALGERARLLASWLR